MPKRVSLPRLKKPAPFVPNWPVSRPCTCRSKDGKTRTVLSPPCERAKPYVTDTDRPGIVPIRLDCRDCSHTAECHDAATSER